MLYIDKLEEQNQLIMQNKGFRINLVGYRKLAAYFGTYLILVADGMKDLFPEHTGTLLVLAMLGYSITNTLSKVPQALAKTPATA